MASQPPSLFGYVVPGRLPVTTGFAQVDQNRFVGNIPAALEIKELTFFMLGTVPLPDGFVAAVYISLPPYSAWQYIGCVSNDNPSAILRIGFPQVVI
mmetsp:Transcript_18102/g.30164  ORF Transcript_18102/g.30164 Transcript_18102/m.30164 type:complete len:97 (+) Transcript_18102:45-335(+)